VTGLISRSSSQLSADQKNPLLDENRASKRKAPAKKGKSGKSNFSIDNEDNNFTERLGMNANETD